MNNGEKLTPDEHEQKKWQAYPLSVKGWHAPAIARQLDVSATTVKALLKEARKEVRDLRNSQGYSDLENFLAEQDAVIADAWSRLEGERLKDNSVNVPSILSTISAASERKAKALGLMKDRLDVTSGDKPLAVTISFDRADSKPD